MITQDTIKTILQTIFQLPDGFIVPKQGTWFNPQDDGNHGTWIAYLIRNARPVAYASWQDGDVETSPIMTVPMIGTLELQFVGPKAETLAQSISLWPIRPDIHALFDSYQAQVGYDNLGTYDTSNFIQDGKNSVLAYNCKITLQWANMIKVSSTIVDTASFNSGNLTVGV